MYSPLLIAGGVSDRFIKVKLILLASMLVFASLNASAEDWMTTDGTKYQDVKVIRVEDDAVTILYKDGGALIYLNKLPSDLQERFNYDPVKAKMAADARTKADAENARLLQIEFEKAAEIKRQEQIRDAAAINTNAPPTR